jgi:hypothetical protein
MPLMQSTNGWAGVAVGRMPAPCDVVLTMKGRTMIYRVYYGPKGSDRVPPLEKDRWPCKAFSDLDEALSWAVHAVRRGTTVIGLDGEDGTQLSKGEIASAVSGRRLL